MTRDGIYSGVIVARTRDVPSPSSEISYTVDVNTAGGVVRATGVYPGFRWPDDVCDTVPFEVGQRVWLGRQSQGWDMVYPGLERPDVGPCEETGETSNPSPLTTAILQEIAEDPVSAAALRYKLTRGG